MPESQWLLQDVILAIVMELCAKGSLFKLIKKAKEVSQLPQEVLFSSVQPRNARERELKVLIREEITYVGIHRCHNVFVA